MTAIQKYKSDSGREFSTPQDAMVADALFAIQNEVNKMLPSAIDDGCDFENGGGYVQQSEADIIAFKHGMRRLIVMEFGENSATLKRWDENPCGFVGRYLDDSGSDTYRLYLRLCCIDDQRREWGQPFYAINPEQGTQNKWEKVERVGMKHFGR